MVGQRAAVNRRGATSPDWLITRERVVAMLDAAISSFPVTLVVASAGSGKSTLLDHWAAGVRTPPVRIRLDDRDRDPLRCARTIVQALPEADIARNMAAPEDLSSDRFRRQLVTAVASLTWSARSGVVFEDVHVIGGSSSEPHLGALVEILSQVEPVVVVTRSEPHWPVSRWRLEGRATEIRQHEVDFDHDEAARLLHRLAPGRLSAADVAELAGRCDGWAAGLVLAGLSARASDDPPAFVASFSGAQQSVADYLFDEVYARFDQPTRRFLLATSVCDRFNSELARALTGDDHASSHLRALVTHVTFVRPVPGSPGWFQYHDLFRDMLLQQLDLEEPGASEGLLGAAAAWCAAQGDVSGQCGFLARLGHWPEIVKVVTDASREGYRSGSDAWLVGLLELIPPAQRDAKADLALASLYLSQGHRWKVDDIATLARAKPSFGAAEALSVDRLAASLIELGGSPVAAILGADRALVAVTDPEVAAASDGIAVGNHADHQRQEAYYGRGRARDLLGDPAGAAEDLRAVYELDGESEAVWVILALGAHALVAAREGHHGIAASLAGRSLRAVAELGIARTSVSANAHLALAVVDIGEGRLAEAIGHLDACRSACLRRNRVPSLIEERIWRAEIHRQRGDVEGVGACLEEISDADPPPPALESDIVALRARLLVDEGQVEAAGKLLTRASVATAALRAIRATVGDLTARLPFTAREIEIMGYLVTHKTSAEIASELNVSVHTVKTHQRHIYSKLGVPNRRQAVTAATALGLITLR